MKRIKNLVVLVLLVGTSFLPGASMGVSAQDADFCAAAADAALGSASEYAGYAIAYGTGGAGSQVVLGSTDGGSVLSGGSGNDVICAWGSGNTLDGGSGNDVLVAVNGEGNMLSGGSGNDTLMGYVNNSFDGGSGRDDIVEWERVRDPRVLVSVGTYNGSCAVWAQLIDFADDMDYNVMTTLQQQNLRGYADFHTDGNGFAEGIAYTWPPEVASSGTFDVLAGSHFSTLTGFSNCGELPPLPPVN